MQLAKVIKPFSETRTPCPKVGTIGRIVTMGEMWTSVEFWEFDDTEGAHWGCDGSEPFVFLFKNDEIEDVSETAGLMEEWRAE